MTQAIQYIFELLFFLSFFYNILNYFFPNMCAETTPTAYIYIIYTFLENQIADLHNMYWLQRPIRNVQHSFFYFFF